MEIENSPEQKFSHLFSQIPLCAHHTNHGMCMFRKINEKYDTNCLTTFENTAQNNVPNVQENCKSLRHAMRVF